MLETAWNTVADWAAQAWNAASTAAEAVFFGTLVALVGFAMVIGITLHLAPILLIWLVGAPLWAVLMLLFGL